MLANKRKMQVNIIQMKRGINMIFDNFFMLQLVYPIITAIVADLVLRLIIKAGLVRNFIAEYKAIWKCPRVESVREKYCRFLLEPLLLLLVMIIVESVFFIHIYSR